MNLDMGYVAGKVFGGFCILRRGNTFSFLWNDLNIEHSPQHHKYVNFGYHVTKWKKYLQIRVWDVDDPVILSHNIGGTCPSPQKHNMPKNAKNAQKTNAAKYKNKKGSALVLVPILVLELVLRLVLK